MIRLYELRTEKNLSQRALAKVIRVSQATYNNWENEKTQPSIEQLIELADFFGVSVDYLIGRTNEGLQTNIPTGNEMLSSFLSLDEETRTTVKILLQKLQKK